jgi:hypothetical protein
VAKKRHNQDPEETTIRKVWQSISWVRCESGHPIYIQSNGLTPPFYRAVYLLDTRLKILPFYSSDRGARVESTADKALILRVAHTAQIQFTIISDEDMGSKF